MKKGTLILTSLILACSSCAAPQSGKGDPAPAVTPSPDIRVVTVAPVHTPTPTPVPFNFAEREPSHITVLSGDYDIVFPSCFDKSSFETGDGYINIIYTSSSVPDVTFTISYTVKDKAVSASDVSSDTREITLPAAVFTEGAEGEVSAILSVSLDAGNYANYEGFTYEINAIK